ncbi:GNAT family N-acetyltransferase [Geomonas propionica]|uniref:GNAT family N-acetyltransferase n=1 Tax=Geomonas propionica TaxID=2798582 RepID=A0ABS0YNI8_9BACT|nr:GNAT family protein [Geomonas propionica]MBJ6799027.1 GNAT family N-acetyltransferase [Geomonas propionica]
MFPTFPRLHTERLVLRQIVPSDADDLFGIFSDAEIMHYWSCRPYTSVEQAHKLIESMELTADNGIGIHWAITLAGDDRLIGKCGYNEWRKVHRRGDVSYLLARDFWEQGIVSEALRAMLDYGFSSMNLHSVEAGVTPGNDASTRMLERLGFRLEGHLRESFWAEDRFVDSLIYSLLRQEWKSAHT